MVNINEDRVTIHFRSVWVDKMEFVILLLCFKQHTIRNFNCFNIIARKSKLKSFTIIYHANKNVSLIVENVIQIKCLITNNEGLSAKK